MYINHDIAGSIPFGEPALLPFFFKFYSHKNLIFYRMKEVSFWPRVHAQFFSLIQALFYWYNILNKKKKGSIAFFQIYSVGIYLLNKLFFPDMSKTTLSLP